MKNVSPFGRTWRYLPALLFLITAAANAQHPAAADANKDAQRKLVSLLKNSALQKMRTTIARDLAQAYPAESRVSFYLDLCVGEFVLQHVVLMIDDRQPIERDYSLREADALLRHSTHRLFRGNFEPGEHHVRVEYTGVRRDAKPEDPRLTGSLELDFNAAPKPQAFVFPLVPDSPQPWFSYFGSARPRPQIREWKGATEDPRIGHVRFLRAAGLNFAALRELLEIAGPADNPAPLPRGYHRLLAHAYIDLGMREQALTELQTADANGHTKLTQVQGQTLIHAWQRMATLDYRRGDYQRALHTLEGIDYPLSDSQKLQSLDVQSRVLIAQGEYAQASAVLADANAILDADPPQLTLPYSQHLYIRYNYALALIKSGQKKQGGTLLNLIGTLDNPRPAKFGLDHLRNLIVTVDKPNLAERAIRDQANLALAYLFLRDAQGATAKTLFQRLPLSGTYSNNALLGLGWTELAPTGERFIKNSPGTYGSVSENSNFWQTKLEIDESEKFKRALVSWNELATRNPEDPAVQEALVVAPFALEKIGDHEQAGKAYANAIDSFTESQRKLVDNIESLRRGTQTRSLLAQHAASGLPYTRWTDDVRTSNPIEEYIQNYHDLQRLQGALLRNPGRDAGSLTTALGYAAVAQLRDAQSVIADELEQQLERIEKYQTTAAYGLTRYYDWKLGEVRTVNR